ncbi:MAG: hypothetical protein ACXWUG_14775 [Polyangiales bacterium]
MPSIVLGVPGLWESSAQVQKACGHLWPGPAPVMRVADRKFMPFSVEVHDRHPDLRRAFEIAGRGQIPPAILAAIERHTMTLYIVTEEHASVPLAIELMKFASLLLDAGGLGVKVECSGAGHSPDTWRQHLANPLPGVAAVSALTVLIRSGDRASSCGMHQLGFPDVDAPLSAGAATLLEFNAFQADHPPLAEGSTFSLRPDSPRFRPKKQPSRYPREQLFHNPFGEWRLETA